MTIATDLRIEPLSPVIGARIRGIDWREAQDGATVDSVRAAFAAHMVLCFPDQKIGARDQVRFAELFGRADSSFRTPTKGDLVAGRKRGVMLVSNIRKDGKPIGSLPDGEMQFHSDGSHRAHPYLGTTLFAVKVPSRGGETLFANLAAAFEALPADVRKRIDGLRARHIYDYDAQERLLTDEDDPHLPSAIHPLVRTHPVTGRKSLYLSRLMTRNIVDMDRAESDALLSELFDHAERPEFVHAHRWTPGDLLIWDNRCVNHARNDFPPEEDRLLRRYTVSDPQAAD